MADSGLPTTSNANMSAITLNHAPNSIESSDSFSAHQREAAETKLYYMRDVCDPEEFQALVEQELERANSMRTSSTAAMAIQNVADKMKIALKKTLVETLVLA
ncbi:hypothetical protein ONS95_005561 [Cadophora gregata]|uniref:uncharacterized protein n=1 Tax=Cadophora gregata TaxID=51156 RepID=UPI0026DBE40E|nr:uncharacterized protein ONS95_005561 [Cadophora gregata]KAK0103542.1 hypothetical protein ONS95_005561 [Cadophora gregata]KAK0107734.1 hypothetical protein ONS96_003533 [Cadophora gregata f. sp. sojae]